MFTGIIEQTGRVRDRKTDGTNVIFRIESPLATSLKIDQSVSHNGVCLTIEDVKENSYQVTAIDETLQKTNLGHWQRGTIVNLERCLQMNGRLDGHIVQGHVDTIATCISSIEKNGSREYIIKIDEKFSGLIIEKGSITVNGISLTIFDVADDHFTVAIIPYTWNHTNMQYLKEGDIVNIEFDMIGKYVNRFMQLKN